MSSKYAELRPSTASSAKKSSIQPKWATKNRCPERSAPSCLPANVRNLPTEMAKTPKSQVAKKPLAALTEVTERTEIKAAE